MLLDLEKELATALSSPAVQSALEDIVRRVVRDELSRTTVGNALVDVEQAAELLSMTPASVRKAAQRGTIPCIRIGRRVRFRRHELLDLSPRPRRIRARP